MTKFVSTFNSPKNKELNEFYFSCFLSNLFDKKAKNNKLSDWILNSGASIHKSHDIKKQH